MITIIDYFSPNRWITVNQPIDADHQEIVRKHTKKLYLGARSMGFSEVDSEELVQDVWLVYFSDQTKFKGESKLSTYLYGILVNKARERWRKDKRQESRDIGDFEQLYESQFDQKGHWITPPLEPQKFSEALENVSAIENCLQKVPTPQRSAFTLRDVSECEIAEVAAELNVSTNNVHVLLFRARASLRECLERLFRGQEK